MLCMMVSFACSSIEKGEDKGNMPVPLKYNNPGLTVDLGVGLWAWPLPMDFDEDGDMDLIVSCPDTPFNGTYFFENKEGPNRVCPIFESPVKVGSGQKDLQISYVDGEPRILGRGVEYMAFKDSLNINPKVLFPREELEKEFTKIRFSQWKYVDYENDGDMDLIVGIDDWGDYGWDNAFDKNGNWVNGPLHGYVFLLENTDGSYDNRGKIMAGGQPMDVYGAPSPNMMDFDGDGDLDLICGEFLDRFTWFENTGTREDPVFAEGRFLSNEQGIIKMDLEMIIPAAVDWDGDGDVDLVVGDEDGRVALVENTGSIKDNMPLFRSPRYFQQKADRLKFGALATPFAVDWDSDGDQDLICGNSAGYIGFFENLDGGNPPKWNKPVYLEAEGEVIRIMAGNSGSIQGPAEKKWGYTTLSVADWDGDSLQDIIINSIWGKILWYKNIGEKGSPELSKARPILVETEGTPPKPAWNWWDPEDNQLVTQWRTTPYAMDWTKDGLTDLIMLNTEGYLSLYERYLENNELKLSPAQAIFYGKNYSISRDNASKTDNKELYKKAITYYKELAEIDSNENMNIALDSTEGPLRLNSREAGASGRRKFCLADWDLDGDQDLLVNGINTSLFLNMGEENQKIWFEYQGPVSALKLAGHTTSPTIVNWDGDNTPDLLMGAEDGHFYYFKNNK